MIHQFSDRVSKSDLCKWVELPSSVLYYKSKSEKRGRKPSTSTFKQSGELVSNDAVISSIREILNQEFCCYGYHNTTSELKDLGYLINHKKVYRLMDENHLLLGKVIRTQGKRSFVKHRRILANAPMEYICLDIKYVWVAGESRNYYLLTVLDVYSRAIIDQIFQKSIKKIDVINVFRRINHLHGIKGVTIRNDNGSQFIANDVKSFLKSAEANQEFTHIATPEENAYIEAFHSIVETEVINRFEFASYYEAKQIFEAHRKWYNFKRKHGKIGRITPFQKWSKYFEENKENINTFTLINEAETGSAGEQPVRNSLSNDDENERDILTYPVSKKLSLLSMP